MKIQYKFMAASAAGLLLGFGLCGIDARFISNGRTEFGGTLSFFGALICLVSLVVLVFSCFTAVVIIINDHWRRR